jgi:long-chain acyl-CoA synthetase
MDEGVMVAMTLNYVIDSICSKYRDKPAIGMALEEPLTYGAFHERIFALALRLQEDGVQKGDHVVILGENSHNWGTAYLAIVRLGAVAVPILPDLPESDVHHILGEMQIKALFITQKQLEKIYEYRGELKIPILVLDDGRSEIDTLQVQPFSTFLETALSGYRQRRDTPTMPLVGENDLASILYTSGTSGYSKAVMLTHKNLTANAYAASALMNVPAGAVWLSILPMSHTYEFTCGFILPLLCGARVAYAGKTPTPAILQKLCAHEKPFVIFAVPLVLEKIYKKRVLPQIENSKLLSGVCRIPMGRRFIYRKIGKKLLSFFGGNLHLMGVGGAALNPEVERFLYEAQFPYLIGYGMTESSPLIAGGPFGDKTIAIGSTGKPIPGVKVKVVDPEPASGIGEIQVCGPNVMVGYYNDAETTAGVLSEDGWLSTGDLGYIDDAGNLHISGRSKNVIVLANGENVYPEAIEHKINSYHWVVESLVLDNNDQVEAWVYPDYEFIDEQTAGSSRIDRAAYIENLLETMRVDINAELPKAARLSKVFERREPFIKTATHKIKRYLYAEHARLG